MDSWKNERFVAKMRAGGNGAFNEFLERHGVPAKVIKGKPGTRSLSLVLSVSVSVSVCRSLSLARARACV